MEITTIISIIDLLRRGFNKIQDLHKGPLIVPKDSMTIFRREDDEGIEYLMIVYRNNHGNIDIIDERLLNKVNNLELQEKINELQDELKKLKTSIRIKDE